MGGGWGEFPSLGKQPKKSNGNIFGQQDESSLPVWWHQRAGSGTRQHHAIDFNYPITEPGGLMKTDKLKSRRRLITMGAAAGASFSLD